MNTYIISSAIIKYSNKYLIGKRTKTKKFDPDKWEFISGFIDTSESAEEIILREVFEETSLNGKIIKTGKPIELIEENSTRWIILPFIVEVNSSKTKLNKNDHQELRWVNLNELMLNTDIKEELNEFKKQKLI